MLLKVILLGLYVIEVVISYQIYNVDDPKVCNKSIYLDNGPNSAAILKLTSRERYSFEPLYCTIKFKVSIHHWSGLTGVIEDVDLRIYKDDSHHMGQSYCVDFIKILTGKHHIPLKEEKQCGSWSVSRGQPLSKFGYKRALVGYCPHTISSIVDNEDCHVTELQVIISIGKVTHNNLWKQQMWKPHRGFTFVVTAYSYPIKNGESECRDGLRSCRRANTPDSMLGRYHCIHDSLWCDGHINCGVYESMDEIACFSKGIWGGLVTVVIGPWMGTTILLALAFCGILYWRSSRIRTRAQAQTNNQNNSYEESHELRSNPSSNHHMAIQVRVVCNPDHAHQHSSRYNPWKADMPPSYNTLFPQGPPQTTSSASPLDTTIGISQNVTANIVTTVAGASISSVGVTSSSSGAGSSCTVVRAKSSSVIDLNVTNNRRFDKSISSIDATIMDSQTNVMVTVSPNHQTTLETNDADNNTQQQVSLQTTELTRSNPVANSRTIDRELPVTTILNECGREELDQNESDVMMLEQ